MIGWNGNGLALQFDTIGMISIVVPMQWSLFINLMDLGKLPILHMGIPTHTLAV